MLLNPKTRRSAVVEHLGDLIARRPRVILTVATLVLLLPFAGKAFHIDDPLFVWAGRHMRTHPFNPYGFDVNWYSFTMPMSDVTKNPPLACGYIALLSAIFGEREVWLHVGFLAQAIAVVLGAYTLASRFCRRPFYAALATLLTPVFLVSSTTLMCDVLMLALWIWATVWWLRAVDKNEPASFILAGLLLGACGLTKYFGVALLPLLLAYSLFKTRRFEWWLLYFLIPVAVFASYEWWTHMLYGKGLLFDAAIYPSSHRTGSLIFQLLTVLAFTGGCFVIVLIFTPFLWAPKVWIGAAVGLLLFLTVTRSSLPFPLYVQGSVMIVGGISVIALSLLDFRRQPDAHSLLLLLWVLGTLVFCLYNWTMNGRSLLPMAPAVAILLWRRIENNPWINKPRYVGSAFATAAMISLLVTQADYQLANTARTAAAEVRQTLGKSSRIWFQGHWGFQYYAQAQGLSAFDLRYSQVRPGDLMVIPGNNTNRVVIPSDTIEPVATIRERPCPWLSTMNMALLAGFYSSIWGPLPFAFGLVPPEEYRIVRFK
jgi:4-amino-4-deoxy-L-arabinose transferase-like glycosyltransferase